MMNLTIPKDIYIKAEELFTKFNEEGFEIYSVESMLLNILDEAIDHDLGEF